MSRDITLKKGALWVFRVLALYIFFICAKCVSSPLTHISDLGTLAKHDSIIIIAMLLLIGVLHGLLFTTVVINDTNLGKRHISHQAISILLVVFIRLFVILYTVQMTGNLRDIFIPLRYAPGIVLFHVTLQAIFSLVFWMLKGNNKGKQKFSEAWQKED